MSPAPLSVSKQHKCPSCDDLCKENWEKITSSVKGTSAGAPSASQLDNFITSWKAGQGVKWIYGSDPVFICGRNGVDREGKSHWSHRDVSHSRSFPSLGCLLLTATASEAVRSPQLNLASQILPSALCGGWNEKCPQWASGFGHLVPSWWCCLGRV